MIGRLGVGVSEFDVGATGLHFGVAMLLCWLAKFRVFRVSLQDVLALQLLVLEVGNWESVSGSVGITGLLLGHRNRM